LILVIITTCSKFIFLGTYYLGFQGYSKFYGGPIRSILIFNIPFYFLYFKSLINDNTFFKKADLLHLITPFIFSIYIFTIFHFGYEKVVYVRLINFLFLSFFSIFYCVKSFYLLNNQLWNIPEKEQTIHYKLIKKWTFFMYGISLLLIIKLLTSFTYEFFSNKSISGDVFILFQSTIWMIFFLKIIISPEILFGLPKLNKKINSHYNKSIAIHPFWKIHQDSISNKKDTKLKGKIDANILNLIKEIEFLAVSGRFFRNQKITIGDLANEMNIPLSHLVYLFKYHCQLTFIEYKTHIKIEDAKQLIESGFLKTNTLESLAIEVGFSSYNPFFTAFKKRVGMSPNDYSISSMSKSIQSLAILKQL
jgi:AraC-like DNA-binding protein